MSPFGKFALGLTVLYVIYYILNIARDLSRKSGGVKEDVEEFDIADMEETSVEVSECEGGFTVMPHGAKDKEDASLLRSTEDAKEMGNEPMSEPAEEAFAAPGDDWVDGYAEPVFMDEDEVDYEPNSDGEELTAVDRKIGQVNASMEEADVASTGGVESSLFAKMLIRDGLNMDRAGMDRLTDVEE